LCQETLICIKKERKNPVLDTNKVTCRHLLSLLWAAGAAGLKTLLTDKPAEFLPSHHRHPCLPSPACEDSVTDDVYVEPLTFNVSGDVAPLGAPDGIVNVADLLIQTQFNLGLSAPGPILCFGQADAILNKVQCWVIFGCNSTMTSLNLYTHFFTGRFK
jgi:hypothetical protein